MRFIRYVVEEWNEQDALGRTAGLTFAGVVTLLAAIALGVVPT